MGLMSDKLKLALFFGGKSPEHEISLQSAKNVAEALDPQKYEIHLIGIDKHGSWYLENHANQTSENQHLQINAHKDHLVLLESGQYKQLIGVNDQQLRLSFDVALPILHGPNGEDGTIQGLLKLANIPFVGAGVLSSAASMDKDIMKRLLRDAHIPIAHFVTIHQRDRKHIDVEALVSELGLPCFVKPANMGSSVGISKVKHKDELVDAIDHAFKYDRKVLIETAISGREIECSILGNDDPRASLPGEIIPKLDFYSYEAKYLDDNGAELAIPANLDASQTAAIQRNALAAFKALQCEGMARVDCFLTAEGKVLINEVNTIPGFTKISMYPKLWEASGLAYGDLLDELIRLALERHEVQQQLLSEH